MEGHETCKYLGELVVCNKTRIKKNSVRHIRNKDCVLRYHLIYPSFSYETMIHFTIASCFLYVTYTTVIATFVATEVETEIVPSLCRAACFMVNLWIPVCSIR